MNASDFQDLHEKAVLVCAVTLEIFFSIALICASLPSFDGSDLVSSKKKEEEKYQ